MSQFDSSGRVGGVLTKSGLLVREPVVLVNLVSALLLEVCVLLRQFGVPLTDGQVDAINAVAGLLLLTAAALFGRKLTTPLADPRDKLGQSLTPETPVAPPAFEVPGTGNVGAAKSPPLDAPLLPPIEEDVARQLSANPPSTPKGEGDNPIGGLRRKP